MKDFDFENIDKRMPYQAPDSFFENACENTLKAAKKRQRVATLKLFGISISAVAAILLFAGLFMFTANKPDVGDDIASATPDSITIIQKKHIITTDSAYFINDVIEELSDQDLEDIISNAEIDILYAGL